MCRTFSVLNQLTSPVDAQAETARRENSSTIREETLEPTSDRRSARHQNWRAVFQFALRELPGEDDVCFLSTSSSLQEGEKK